MASRSLTVLMVGGHPADCFDQAGGTLAHHAAAGDRVVAVTVSTGVRTHHFGLVDRKRACEEGLDIESEQLRAVQQKLDETRRACEILGFGDVRTLGFEDDDVLMSRELVDRLTDVIREVRPDVIITHHPYEMGGFKLHATTGQATLYAWQVAMGTGRGSQASHYCTSLFFMNPMGYMGHNSLGYASTAQVNVMIDVTDVIDKKVAAMDLVGSQYYDGAYARKVHEASDGHYGQLCAVAYAEPFQSHLPMVRYTLPVSDADLYRQVEPNSESIARRGEIIAGQIPLPNGQKYTSAYRFSKTMYDA